MVQNRPRVLLADDHTLVLEGLRRLLESEFELLDSVEDGRALLEAAPRLQPDVILLDISMPLLNGIDAARQLRGRLPRVKLIFLTMHAEAEYVVEAFRAGASGYLLKRSAASELISAIRQVLRGQRYVTPLVTGALREAGARRTRTIRRPDAPAEPVVLLTPRQREVLQLVAEGRATKEIASILNISSKTVEFHKSRIMEALSLHSTAELTRYAIRAGILQA
jgi:DNA-binding NarL/FixJ family response regulator